MKLSKNSFLFCKISVTIILWISFLTRSKILLIAVFLILLSSAILTIRRAPMILLYQKTFGKIIKSKNIFLDPDAMRFAHSLGSIIGGIGIALVYLYPKAGWGFVLVFAIMKTISSAGYCPGEKIYSCMKGGCCKITRR